MVPMSPILPLSQRRLDLFFLGFFIINLGFITYIVDLEQLMIADPSHFTYPVWPPARLVDLVHWYGRSFDPPLMAREAWWRATIWIDAVFFGPFYAFAIYAFVKGRAWIRTPAIIWASVMMTNVTIILFEELVGAHPTARPGIVLALNAPWLLTPPFLIWRVTRREHPFVA